MNRPRTPRRWLTALALLLALGAGAAGCGRSAQAMAYARAEEAERHFTTETAPAIIADYQRVIALDPTTDWAKKAGGRIQALQARVRTQETHKDVFQEHGVD